MLGNRGDMGKGVCIGTQKYVGSHSFPYHVVRRLYISSPKSHEESYVKALSFEFAGRRVC